MARREDEAEQIIAYVFVDRRVNVRAFHRALHLASELFVLPLEQLPAPQ